MVTAPPDAAAAEQSPLGGRIRAPYEGLPLSYEREDGETGRGGGNGGLLLYGSACRRPQAANQGPAFHNI